MPLFARQQLSGGFVPLLTSQAGSCLTFANWKEASVKAISCHLADLLMKPGLSVLNSLSTIRSYFNWSGEVILNAMLPPPNREDVYKIRSLYDGAIIQIDASSLFALISQLQPERVILPLGSAGYFSQFWNQQSVDTMVYLHESENLPDTATKLGRYINLDSQKSFSRSLAEINTSHEHLYIMGDFNLAQMKELSSSKKYLFESDKPASDGMTGVVYSFDGPINILDTDMMNDHQPIDSRCSCQTCRTPFTRAHLHHLLQHTPLLAQRYLIQHNVSFMFL